MKYFFTLVILFVVFQNSFAQHPDGAVKEPASLVKWLTFKEALELNKKNPRPFLIDFYTDWCGWCKHMMGTTYSTAEVATYVNTYFYPIKFNAEGQDTIRYEDSTFVNRSKLPRSTHDLTSYFLGRNLMYPSTVFMSSDLKFRFNTQGYLDVKGIEPLLVYMVENVYFNASYDDFKPNFLNTFYDTLNIYKKEKITAVDFKQVKEKLKTKPRKWIVNINTDWCNSCKVLNKTSYTDSAVVKYLNDNFYLVNFDAQSKDSITFNGTKFENTPANGVPFHALAMALTKNQLTLPSTVIMDENSHLIDVIPRYITPKMLNAILHFYNEDAYKNTPWDKFYKDFQLRK